MITKTIKIDEVKSNPKNPRVIKNDKFHKLVKSIQEFPQMLDIRPVVVDENNIILGGNMRWKASKEAGLKEIPVMVVSDLTEEQKNEFIIKDNVGYGDWDWDILSEEWSIDDLKDWALDIPGLNADYFSEAGETDFNDGASDDTFSDDVNENKIKERENVVVTLTMSKTTYYEVEETITDLTKNNSKILCKIEN